MLSRGMLPRNIGCRLGALAFTVEAIVGINSLHVAESKAALSAPPNSKNDPKRARAGTAELPVFLPVSSLLFAFAEIS